MWNQFCFEKWWWWGLQSIPKHRGPIFYETKLQSPMITQIAHKYVSFFVKQILLHLFATSWQKEQRYYIFSVSQKEQSPNRTWREKMREKLKIIFFLMSRSQKNWKKKNTAGLPIMGSSLESWKNKYQHKHQVALLCCTYQFHLVYWRQTPPLVNLPFHKHAPTPLQDKGNLVKNSNTTKQAQKPKISLKTGTVKTPT